MRKGRPRSQKTPGAPGEAGSGSGEIPIAEIAARVGTPFYLYHASKIRERIGAIRDALGAQGIAVRYAMKACSAKKVLQTMRDEGIWIDAVSGNEVLRARAAGFPGGSDPPAILFTADVFRDEALEAIRSERILANIGSPRMVEELSAAGVRGPLGLRINPGFGHGHVQACDTGGPSSKHGIWPDEETRVRKTAESRGFSIVLLHAHLGTGTGIEEFQSNMERLLEFYLERAAAYPHLESVNFGGGIPHNYRPGAPPLDLRPLGSLLRRAREELSRLAGRPIRVEIEPGRHFMAGAACIVSRVKDVKRTSTNEKGKGQTFVMVDAGFCDLIRPAMYGSYHEIAVPGKSIESDGAMEAVVAGPLCESGDVFTRNAEEFLEPRRIPAVKPGDLLLIQDAGAYGSSMSSNYNSVGRAPQVWWDSGKAYLISRRETYEDIVCTECFEEIF